MPEIILYNVQIMCLREKIAAYTILFDRKPTVSVSGSFRDQAGELAFLHRFYVIDGQDHVTRQYFTLWIDGERCKVTPVNEVIAKVKMCHEV